MEPLLLSSRLVDLGVGVDEELHALQDPLLFASASSHDFELQVHPGAGVEGIESSGDELASLHRHNFPI